MTEQNKTILNKDSNSDQVNLEEVTPTNDDIVYQEDNVIYCSKCGTKNQSSSKYCSSCGNSLKNIEDNIRETTNSIKSAINNSDTYRNFISVNSSEFTNASWNNKDMVDFIQKNPEYYIPKLEEMQKYKKSTSWNWASFFLLPWWLLYRKMYAYGFGVMVLSFILSYIPFIGFISLIAIPILGGLYGNSIYLKYIEKNLAEFRGLNEDARHRVILSKGGVNIALPIIIFIVSIIFASIAGFIGAIAMLSYY